MDVSVFKKSITLCWFCANAITDRKEVCPWASDLEPVPGWVAEQSTKRPDGYTVKKCPRFKEG